MLAVTPHSRPTPADCGWEPAVEVSSQGVLVYRFSDVESVPLEFQQLSPPEP